MRPGGVCEALGRKAHLIVMIIITAFSSIWIFSSQVEARTGKRGRDGWFGGLTAATADTPIADVITLIACDSTAPSSGMITQIRTNFGHDGVCYRVKVLRRVQGTTFALIAESGELESTAGLQTLSVNLEGVQAGDYIGITGYADAADLDCGYRNHSSDYYYYEGDHAEGTEQYSFAEDYATICIEAYVGEPPTPTYSPAPTETPPDESTPTPTHTPTPYYTSPPTFTPEPFTGVKLRLNRLYFVPGDPFDLKVLMGNEGTTTDVDLYVLLEVYGEFWFYPSWGRQMDKYPTYLRKGYHFQDILSFVWPEVSDAVSGIKFISAVAGRNNFDIIGQTSLISWGFGPGND